jgi:hypothetical protein
MINKINKIDTINYLKKLYDQYGIKGLDKRNLLGTPYFEYIINNKKNYMDVQEYCCYLLDKEDEYIIYISICND